jgi:hypothetical protein
MGTNSVPSGHKLRWYPLRALRRLLGKHGLAKMRLQNHLPPLNTKGGYLVRRNAS